MAQRPAAGDRPGGHICRGVGDAGCVQPPGPDPLAAIGRFPACDRRGNALRHPDPARDGASTRRGGRGGGDRRGTRNAGRVGGSEGRHRRIGGKSHPRCPSGDARDGACLVTSLRDWLGFRRRDSAGDTVLLIAREVTDRQRSVQGGLAEIRDPSVLDRLSAEDFEGLDLVIEEEDDDIAEVNAALALGDLLRKEGERTEAQALFRRAGRGAQRLDYQHGIAEALVRQIEMLPRNTDLETMAALQRQASEAARRTADLGLQSRIVISLAETLRRNGKIPEAVNQLEEGLIVSRQIGDLAMEGRCLTTLAEIEHSRGRIAAAAGHERDLATLEDRRGNRAAAAEWAIRMGTSLLDLDDIPAALDAFSRGLDLAVAAGDVTLEQRALGGIGMAFARAGRRSESLEHLMRALDLARAARDRRNEARWLATLGQILWRFEQPQEAMRALSDALAAAQRVEDLGLQATILTQLGRMYAGGGQTARAKECYTHAYGLNRRLGQTEEQIDLLNLLSALAAETGQLPAAIAFGEQALQLAAIGNDRLTETRLRIRLGRLAMSRGDTTAALDHFTRGVALAETMGQPAIQAQALSALAGAQAALKDPAAAVTYRRALNQARAGSDPAGEAHAALGLGQMLLNQGARVEGSQMLQEAGAAARRMGAKGASLARRADDLLAGIGPLESVRPATASAPHRREAATPPGT